jgi:hypothetical protein
VTVVKLNRLKLIEVARSGLKKSQSQRDDWDKRVDDAEAAWERNWKTVGVEQWRPLRDKITKALKTKEPITANDLPIRITNYIDETTIKALYRPFNRGYYKNAYSGSRGTWTADHDFGPPPTVETQAFEHLADFLEAVEDETVTSGQIEHAGFRNMAKLWTAASQGYWT